MLHRIKHLPDLTYRQEDGREMRRVKLLLVWLAVGLIPITLVMGIVFWSLQLWVQGAIPLAYAGITSILLVHFIVTKDEAPMRWGQMIMIMLLPTSLMWMLGGFSAGSAMMIWSVLPPVAALVYAKFERAKYWFAAFIGLLVISAVIDHRVQTLAFDLPSWVGPLFFVMNLGFVTTALFMLFARTINEERESFRELDEKRAHLEAMQGDLIVARDEAEAGSRAKSQFLANISHEIRTPMNAIIGLSELTLRSDLNPKQQDYLTKIYLSANNMLQIINDLLDYSKVEAGKMVLEHSEIDLERVLSDLATIMAADIERKGLELLFDVSPDVPTKVMGDSLRLGQVLLNLTGNAKKFTSDGDIVVSLSCVERTESKMRARFAVKDSGIGITTDQQSGLFQPFAQGEAGTTRKFGGTGLGLAICKQLVDLMGGTIGLSSEIGKGSEFFFEVPFELATEDSQKTTTTGHESVLTGTKVLVVDDNENALEIISSQLEYFGLDVTKATGAIEAEALITSQDKSTPFTLALIDYRMPDVDGLTLANRVVNDLQLNSTPKLVLITAATRLFDEEPAELTQHIDATLTKPLNPSLLFDTLINVTSGKPMPIGRSRVEVYDERTLAPIKGARLLLVEDNELNQQVAIDLLELGGFHIDVAENGLEAITKIENNRYDCVLMDIHMPEMDGYTATRFIRQEMKLDTLPILAMTANVLEADVREAFESGMNAHIGKPIEPGKLFDALLKWIPSGNRLPSNAPTKRATNEFRLPAKLTNVDMGKALIHVNGRRDLLADLLIDFSTDFAEAPQQLKQTVTDADVTTGHRLAHSIKGILGTLGATSLQAQAQTIEQRFKDEDFVKIMALLPDFSQDYAELINEVMAWREEQTSDSSLVNAPQGPSEFDIASIIARLRGHLDNFNPSARDEALLLAEALPHESALTEALLENVNQFDFDTATKNLETLHDRINGGRAGDE